MAHSLGVLALRVTLVFLLSMTAACASLPTTVYLVRHAEKAPDPGDGNPELSDLGHQRARDLARTLADVAVDRIITTDLVRTQQTAQPTAAAKKINIEVLDSEDIKGLADRLQDAAPGQRLLVVGHSHTIPSLLAVMGAPATKIASGDYDDLFVILISDGKVQMDRLHVGAVAHSK